MIVGSNPTWGSQFSLKNDCCVVLLLLVLLFVVVVLCCHASLEVIVHDINLGLEQ